MKSEHHLEERRIAEAALRMELFHQLLERQILMGIGSQRGFSYPAQQRTKTRIARKIAAQRQGVDEEADQVFGLRLGAVGDGSAD